MTRRLGYKCRLGYICCVRGRTGQWDNGRMSGQQHGHGHERGHRHGHGHTTVRVIWEETKTDSWGRGRRERGARTRRTWGRESQRGVNAGRMCGLRLGRGRGRRRRREQQRRGAAKAEMRVDVRSSSVRTKDRSGEESNIQQVVASSEAVSFALPPLLPVRRRPRGLRHLEAHHAVVGHHQDLVAPDTLRRARHVRVRVLRHRRPWHGWQLSVSVRPD